MTPDGEVCLVFSNVCELEIPDNTTEALVEMVEVGKSNATALDSRMWCPSKGIMDVASYIGMTAAEAKLLELEKQRCKEKSRREKEAREVTETPKPEAKPEANVVVVCTNDDEYGPSNSDEK
jgi:hypothetical protein